MTWAEAITTILTPGGIAVVIFMSGKLFQRMKVLEVRMDKFELRMDKFEERMNAFERRLNKLAIAVSNIRTRLKRIERTSR